MKVLKNGDVVCLFSEDGKIWFVKIEKRKLSTHKGIVDLQGLVGRQSGGYILTSTNNKIYFFVPSLEELILHYVKRSTQIIYPKDAGYLILKLGIKEGMKVLEIGTGSGAMTLVLAHFVGDSGKVYTYEERAEFTKRAEALIKEFNLEHRVCFHTINIECGIKEKDFDAALIDLKEPERYLRDTVNLLSCGAAFGIVVPTTNQVCAVIQECETLSVSSIDICEVFIRKYRVNAERLRPQDVMVGHTAYLITGRKIKSDSNL